MHGKHAPGLPPPKLQMGKGAGVLMHMLPSVAGGRLNRSDGGVF